MKIAFGVSETRMNMIETKLNKLNGMFDIIEQNQIELAGRGQWMLIIEDRVTGNRQRITLNESELRILENQFKNIYTRQDADQLEDRIILRIKNEIDRHTEETHNE
jgi:hypothetical protein